MIKIVQYTEGYQKGIDRLMQEINAEFLLEPAPPGYLPKLPDSYWVALYQDVVIGTIGINAEGGYAVLKRMFLKAEFRGKEKGIASKLFNTAIEWSVEKKLTTIYLGTLLQFEAAGRFYTKKGFEKIDTDKLPVGFPHNPIDNVFYKLSLKE